MWSIISSIFTLAVLLGLTIMAYAHYIEPHALEVTHFYKKHNQKSAAKLRIVQISDIHLGDHVSLRHFDSLIHHINALSPDVVLLTGDLFDQADRYAHGEKVGQYLAKINALYGKYMVYGNHEYNGDGVGLLASVAAQGNFDLLVNTIAKLPHPVLELYIGGADCSIYGERRPEFCSEFKDQAFNVLMLHQADAVTPYKHYPIDLVLSGHTHAGQIAFPYFGAVILPEMGKRYIKGWYDLHNERRSQLYVNRGFGMTMLPFRLLARPELTIIDLEP